MLIVAISVGMANLIRMPDAFFFVLLSSKTPPRLSNEHGKILNKKW